MRFRSEERGTLTVLGVAILMGLGLLLYQQHRPRLAIVASSAPIHAAQWNQALDAARRVDVNTAGVAELERLPEVGPALARRIVDYRTQHGPFQRPEELSNVRGIGPKMYEVLKNYVNTE